MSELVIRVDIAPDGDIHHQVGSALDNLKKQLLEQTVDDMREIGRMTLWRSHHGDEAISVYPAGSAYFVFDDGDRAMRAVQRRFAWARAIVAEMTPANISIALVHQGFQLFGESPAVLAETLVSLLVEDVISEDELADYRSP